MKSRMRSIVVNLINEKLLNENKRDAIFKAPVVKIGHVIYSKTLELMTTFMGSWRRKNVDSINYIRMNNFQQSKKADSSGPFIYLRSILHYELIRDDRIISTYNPHGPLMSYISSDWRADLFNRMIQVLDFVIMTLPNLQLQQHIGFSTETEHLATVLVDRYTWRKLIDPDRYDLLGMVAISMAAKITCRRRKMAEMELKMISVLEYDLVSPIPHTFLGFAIGASLEVLEELGENEYFLLARYIFELGLTEMALSQCSASLKCAAAIYLIRHLLRLRGQRSCSKHHLLNLSSWTNSLTAATGHKESKALRRIAYSYGLMLIEAQFFLNDIAPPGKMTGCATKYKKISVSTAKTNIAARRWICADWDIYNITPSTTKHGITKFPFGTASSTQAVTKRVRYANIRLGLWSESLFATEYYQTANLS
ncbi:hypothetical protein ACTXT7_004875 [Hymenolepis weldensis]